MGIFSNDEDHEEDDYDDEERESFAGKFLLGIFILPAIIVGVLHYLLLRIFKLRFSVIASIVAFTQFISVLLFVSTDSLNTIISTVSNPGELGSSWGALTFPIILISIFLGGFIGLGIVGWELREMKKNPHRLELPGNWMYGFEFRRTPLELLKKKKLIGQLKSGELQSVEKAPLGLNEDGGYSIVSRYASEANKHTLIVGASGSGKALHKDTLIPTLNGMKTVENVKENEVLFDENGQQTRILGKYQPMTEDHYEMTFSDGTTLKACGDHQWRVIDGGRTKRMPRKKSRLLTNDQRLALEKRLELTDEDKLIASSNFTHLGIGSYSRWRNVIQSAKVSRNLANTIENKRNYFFNQPDRLHLKKAMNCIILDDDDRLSRSSTQYDPKVFEEDTLSTKAIFATQKLNGGSRYSIPLASEVGLPERELPIDPYLFGAWLGDGNSRDGTIGNSDVEVRDRCMKAHSLLWERHTEPREGRNKDEYCWKFENVKEELDNFDVLMKGIDLKSKKDVPEIYMYSSIEQRVALISGLMDTDGTCKKGGIVGFVNTNKDIIDKARWIVCSLGWKASKIYSFDEVKDGDGRKKVNEVFSFTFLPDRQIFEILRKNERLQKRLDGEHPTNGQQVHNRRYIVNVAPVNDVPEDYYCFEVDSPSHLYLATESFIPTHNTITMQSLLLNDISNGTPVVLIDMKRSPEFASKLSAWTKDAGGSFHHFVNGETEEYDVQNSPGQAFYDPLKSGSPTSKADMVLGMREYDTASAVYRANMQQLLQVTFAMLRHADKKKAPSIQWGKGGIYEIASAVSGSNILELAAACEGTPIQDEAEEVSLAAQGKTGIKHAIDELQGQMRTIIASEYGRWLKLSKDRDKNIDLFTMTQKSGTVILFSLNSDAEPDFARYVGSMIMADLTATSARRRNSQMTNQVNVYIDEFQAINPSSIAGLLEKSRESHIAMTLAQQSFEQIVASTPNNGEAYLLSILDTCSNFIVHSGATEDSAERLSKLLGKEWVDAYRTTNKNKSSFLSTNRANKQNQQVQTSREERWRFEPAKFMSLSSPDQNNDFKSTAVIVNKTCSDPLYKSVKGGLARTTWMMPSDKVLEKYYVPRFNDNSSTAVEEGYDEELEAYTNENHAAEPPHGRTPELELDDDVFDDGDFIWETVDDEETENEFNENIANIEPEMEESLIQTETPKKRKKSVQEGSSFEQFATKRGKNVTEKNDEKQKFGSDEPLIAQPNIKKETSKVKKGGGGIPRKPIGIPTKPISSNSSTDDSTDDVEEVGLPDISDLL